MSFESTMANTYDPEQSGETSLTRASATVPIQFTFPKIALRRLITYRENSSVGLMVINNNLQYTSCARPRAASAAFAEFPDASGVAS